MPPIYHTPRGIVGREEGAMDGMPDCDLCDHPATEHPDAYHCVHEGCACVMYSDPLDDTLALK